MKFIPICEPTLFGNETKYVMDAIETGWISSSGKYISAFEEAFAAYCSVRGMLLLSVTALLPCMWRWQPSGIGKGDKVVIPDFTMILQ